jgi:hypothetical protein
MARRSGVVLVLGLLLIGCANVSETADKCSAQTVKPPAFTPAVSLLGLGSTACCCSETTT